MALEEPLKRQRFSPGEFKVADHRLNWRIGVSYFGQDAAPSDTPSDAPNDAPSATTKKVATLAPVLRAIH